MSRPDRTEPYDAVKLVKQASLGINVIHCPDPAALWRSLPMQGPIVVGRQAGDGVTMAIDDRKLSRKHCTFRAEQSKIVVEDHGSLNGTFVNGARISQVTPVAEGDVVRVGQTLFEIGAPLASTQDATILGRSASIARLLADIDKVAKTSAAVLIVAETGTGKELVAERLHRMSGRQGKLVPVNCAALPETLAEAALFGHTKGAFTSALQDHVGFFERSDGGTLFLDEIGVLPDALQPKLLRALESSEVQRVGAGMPKKIDLRVVAATNVDLQAAADAGRFRSDLYARLAAFVINIPPLAARKADVPMLAAHFLAAALPAGKALTMSVEFVEALVLYSWPRNVRELKAFMQRCSVVDDTVLGLGHVPQEVLRAQREGDESEEPETSDPGEVPSEADLLKALEACQGNVSRVAEHYGRKRQQVYRWLKRYNLDLERFRPPE